MLGKLDSHMEKNELGPHTKTNTKWIKDFSIRPETVKLVEGNIGRNLRDIGFGNDFMDKTPKHGQPKIFVFIRREVGVQV